MCFEHDETKRSKHVAQYCEMNKCLDLDFVQLLVVVCRLIIFLIYSVFIVCTRILCVPKCVTATRASIV
jgi:hypothetical protein